MYGIVWYIIFFNILKYNFGNWEKGDSLLK